MKVYMFKPQFAQLVHKRKKRTTIRPKRKHPTKIGDVLSLREWTGKPYRSQQRTLTPNTFCIATHDVSMHEEPFSGGGVYFVFELDGKTQSIPEVEAIAKDDGFKDGFEMWKWFKETHGLPFRGDLIRW